MSLLPGRCVHYSLGLSAEFSPEPRITRPAGGYSDPHGSPVCVQLHSEKLRLQNCGVTESSGAGAINIFDWNVSLEKITDGTIDHASLRRSGRSTRPVGQRQEAERLLQPGRQLRRMLGLPKRTRTWGFRERTPRVMRSSTRRARRCALSTASTSGPTASTVSTRAAWAVHFAMARLA